MKTVIPYFDKQPAICFPRLLLIFSLFVAACEQDAAGNGSECGFDDPISRDIDGLENG